MGNRYKYCILFQNESDACGYENSEKRINMVLNANTDQISEEIIENSANFVIVLNGNIRGLSERFRRNIEEIAENASETGKKRVLYTIEGGTSKSANIQKVRTILKTYNVKKSKSQYIRNYTIKKILSYMKASTPIKEIIALIGGALSEIAYQISNLSETLGKILWYGSLIWGAITGFVSYILSLFGVELSGQSIQNISAVLAAVPVPVVWVILKRTEYVSPNPLKWVRIRRGVIFLCAFLLADIYAGAFTSHTSAPVFDFERLSVEDIKGSEDNIYVRVNDIFEPDGEIWIESEGDRIYSSAHDRTEEQKQDNTFSGHMINCPELTDGETYTLGWDLDTVEKGQTEFVYHKGEPVEIYLESVPGLKNFCNMTKEKLLEAMTMKKTGVSMTKTMKIYSDNNKEPVVVDLTGTNNKDVLFSADIGMICFLLKQDSREVAVVFTASGSDIRSEPLEEARIPDGSVPVTLEFVD